MAISEIQVDEASLAADTTSKSSPLASCASWPDVSSAARATSEVPRKPAKERAFRWLSAPELDQLHDVIVGTRDQVFACLTLQGQARTMLKKTKGVPVSDDDVAPGARDQSQNLSGGGAQVLTSHSCGWDQPGLIDAIEARWSEMQDLPLETASRDDGTLVSEAEEASLPQLKAAILSRLGLDAPPRGFRSSHFTRWKLLFMLRARGGDVDRATARALECIEAVDLAFKHARAYEAAPAHTKRLRAKYLPNGMFGQDKRGAPVMYGRLGLADAAGIVRETGMEFYRHQEFYTNLVLWDTLYQQSVRKGVALLGGLFVFDVTGLSLSGGLANYRAVKALVEDPVYPAGEHPLPEGMRKCLICNAPWWIGRVWDVVKLLLPARTVAKVSLFRADRPEEFMAEMLKRVDIDQVPDWLGGKAAGWPYLVGGTVPPGG